MAEVMGRAGPRINGDPEFRAKGRGAQLGDQLFHGVCVAAEPLGQVTIAARGAGGPMSQLVQHG